MGEIFIPLSKTVKELFDGNNYYQVPSYQRPYRWKTENVEELWEDLTNAIENDDEEYFLGSIILTKNKSNKYLDVIDGQQRLTTLTILFCVLRDIYYNQIEDKKTKNTILGRIKSLETDNERLRFKTQSQKQNSFEQEILKEINFNKKRNKSEIQSDSFLNTAYLFKDKIETLLDEDPKKIEEFTDYVLDKVRIITIECTTQSLAIKLFQVLNIRGMDLTPADLIKSYLMSKLKEDDWDSFEHTWTEIETLSNELGENLTELFTYYEYYLLASNPKRALYVELEKQFKNRDAKEIIYEFKKLISYFVEIDTENSKIIHGLNYLRHDVFWKSILLSAKMENWEQQDFNQLASLLRKFYYLYWIAGYTTTKTKQTSFNVISWIKSKKNITYIEDEINQKLLGDKVINSVIRNLTGDIYGYPWCKPTLAMVEYAQTDESNINFIDLDKYVHVEHILPQGYARINYWKNLYSDPVADKLLNTFGNLTLLSGKKNIIASNRPFPEKIEIYKGKGIDGMTGFVMTQKLVTKIQNNKDWTKKEIVKRKEFFFEELGKILSVNLFQEVSDIEEETTEEPKGAMITVYPLLRDKILALDDRVKVESKKYYIAFKVKQNFVTLKPQQNKIKIWLNLKDSDVTEELEKRDVTNLGHHGTGNLEVIITSKEQINLVIPVIKKALEKELSKPLKYTQDYRLEKIAHGEPEAK